VGWIYFIAFWFERLPAWFLDQTKVARAGDTARKQLPMDFRNLSSKPGQLSFVPTGEWMPRAMGFGKRKPANVSRDKGQLEM
jgi:hypothetical protein